MTRSLPVLALLIGMVSPLLVQAQQTTDEKTPEVEAVDLMNALFGRHPGFRAAHAKGIVATGTFTPTPEAAALSRAPHLQGTPVPVTVRFSKSSGRPDIPDGSPAGLSKSHGVALKFKLPDGAETDIVINTLPFFPVRTVSEFRDLLLAVKASGPDAPKPTKLDQFFAEHPNALKALSTPKIPESYATEQYNGINAFKLVNKAGQETYFRYRLFPAAGIKHLETDDAARRPPDFLGEDLERRIQSGPVEFRLMAQIAEPGDPTDDASVQWPEDRKLVTLGTVALTAIAPDNLAASKSLVFFPGNVPDGIEPSEDPLIASRDAAYAESLNRRSQ